MTVATRTPLARQTLLTRLSACSARIFRFIAPGGYGKSTIAWELGVLSAPVSSCSFLGVHDENEVWRRLITALAQLDGAGGLRIAQESLTLAFADSTSRNDYLQLVSARADLHGTLLIDDVQEAGDAATAPLRALLGGRPRCRIIVCSRAMPAVPVTAWYAPHEFVTVREADLQFDAQDLRALLPDASKEVAEHALAWSGGWPIAAVRAAAMIHDGQRLPDSAVDDAWMQRFIVQTVESASRAVRESLFRLAALRTTLEPRELDVPASAMPFVSERSGGAIELHALVREVLQRLYAGECTVAAQRLYTLAFERGDHLRCAELALEQRNNERAADALERSGQNPLELPSARYLAVLERLGSATILARPRLWWICATAFQSDFLSMAEQLEPVLRDTWNSLPPATQSVAAALVCLRKAEYRGEWEGAWAMLDDYESRIHAASLTADDRLVTALCRCSIASNSGWEFDQKAFSRDYGALLQRYPSLVPDVRYLQATQAFFRADAAAVVEAIEQYVDAMRALDDSVQLRAGLYRALWLPWEIGAYELHERLRGELVEILGRPTTPDDLLTRIAWEMIDAAQGVAPVREDATVAIGCLTNLLNAACSDDYHEAVGAMQEAVHMSKNPAYRAMAIVARVAAFAFDPAYEPLLDGAFDNFRSDACPKMRKVVAAVRRGEDDTFLQPFVSRFRAAGERSRRVLFVDTARGRVSRNGADIPFTQREYALFMLLASAGRPLQTFEIAERLWPESDDDAARNALKVCLSRIRARAGNKDVISTTGGDVSIAPAHVQTDIARAERLAKLAEEGSVMAGRAARAILERHADEVPPSGIWHELLRARVNALRARGALRP